MEPRGGGSFKHGQKEVTHMRIVNASCDHGIHEEAKMSVWIGPTIIQWNLRGVEK